MQDFTYSWSFGWRIDNFPTQGLMTFSVKGLVVKVLGLKLPVIV